MVRLNRVRPRRDERGVVTIVVSLTTCLVFLGLAALVVNLGMARDGKQASQIASDSSALAAANKLYPTLASGSPGTCANPVGGAPPCFKDALKAAKDYALANLGVPATAWTGCLPAVANPAGGLTDTAASNSCIWFDSSTKPKKVRVSMPQSSVAAGFGKVYGKSTVKFRTSARAIAKNPNVGRCALCFLGSVSNGNADFSVTGGSIAVNGNITSGPGSIWSAPTSGSQIGVVGTTSGGSFTPAVTKTTAFTDPYADLVLPTKGSLTVRTDPCAAAPTGGPGIYGAFSIPNSTCTLQPGLYIIVGTWDEKNNSNLIGTGVTLYFTCGTTAAPHVCLASDTTAGMLDGKNGLVTITSGAPGFADWAIVYDRLNPKDIQLQGNGGTSLTGGVYAPNSTLGFNGNACFGFRKGPVVALSATGNGTKGCVTITDAIDATLTSKRFLPSLDQ